MKPDPEKIKNATDFYKDVAPYLGLGLQLAVTVVAFVFLGIWLDKKFDIQPVLTIIFSFLGVTIALYNFIRSVLKSGKK